MLINCAQHVLFATCQGSICEPDYAIAPRVCTPTVCAPDVLVAPHVRTPTVCAHLFARDLFASPTVLSHWLVLGSRRHMATRFQFVGIERDVELRFHLHRLEGGGGGGMTDGAALEEDDLPLALPLPFVRVLPAPPLPADPSFQSARSMKCLIHDWMSPSLPRALSKRILSSLRN